MSLRSFTPPDALPHLAPSEGEIEAVARKLAEAEAPQFGPVPAWRIYCPRAAQLIVEARALKASGVAL